MNEPARRSYLDLMKTNMGAADRTQFITRFVYFGAYQGTDVYLQNKFETVVNYLRLEYPDVPLTGLLLVYPQYFLHIIETSEELIFRHLHTIFYDKEMSVDLGRVLPLPPYHHVDHCFFQRWLKVFTKPPELLEKLEDTGLEEIEKQLTHCLSKVYTLCEYISSKAHGTLGSVDEVMKSLRDNNQQYLPESTVIDYLLKSNSLILRDVREYVSIAPVVPFIRLYNENIWPPTCDFMPQNVFIEHTLRRDLMLQRFSQNQQMQRLI